MPDWNNLPVEVRRHLTKKLVTETLALYGGWRGLVCRLYRNTRRPDGTRLSALASGDDLYKYVLEDQASASAPAQPQEPAAPVAVEVAP